MSKIEKAIKQMEEWAADNSHGYDQIYRWGEKGDFDCSAAVIQAWENAGVPVKTNGATYTGNMLSVFKKCGFKDITSSINLATGKGLERGDVLLNQKNHTAMYCGNGYEVEASINEKNTATGGKPGDQTGREFLKRTYRNYPWTNILRYTEKAAATVTNEAKETPKTTTAVKVDPAYKFDKAYAKTYTVTASALNMRSGAGTNKTILKVLKNGEKVTCYGYYNQKLDTIWLYVMAKDGTTGYCSMQWLKRTR